MDTSDPYTMLPSVHIWRRIGGGLTTYLCGTPWESVVAAVGAENARHFPDEMFCPICLSRYREQSRKQEHSLDESK